MFFFLLSEEFAFSPLFLLGEYGADEIVSTKINWQQFVDDEGYLTGTIQYFNGL